MKKSKILILLAMFIIMIVPVNVLAGGGNDDKKSKYELPIPDSKVTFIKEYSEFYECTYRLNFSEESPIWQGSFDFVVTFSKLGGAKNIIVSQASEVADWTYNNGISKLVVENNIPKTPYYLQNRGYYCPDLMAYVTEKEHKGSSFSDGIFKVTEYDPAKYVKNKKKQSINIWYKIHDFKETSYDCRASEKNKCIENKYCGWQVIDRAHDDFACLEKEYGVESDEENPSTSPEPEPDKTRTESCKGYTDKLYDKTIEYSFSLDGQLNVNSGAGESLDFFGGDKYVDKENQLYNLWKEGKCCANDKLGANVEYESGQTIITLSCDGSNSDWEYETPGTDESDPDKGELEPGTPISGCEVIPEVVRKWIVNILKIVRYISLVLVIVLGALDFMKAAAGGEPDAMKKAGQSFMKRMIAVIVLFLLPVIVDFILNMVNIYGVDPDNIDCL